MEEGYALLQLLPKHKTEGILRYAQDDQDTVGWEGGYPLPIFVTPRSASDEGSPLFSGGGELTLLQLHPRRNRGDPSLRSG